ncbi:hypothetical protein E2320_021961 [Naja naja]|nr:hypothetical protein E2320_021961 [Naja naja]
MDFRDLSYRDLVLNRPYVPLNTLETNFPTPLYSDQYLSLRGPRNAPVIKEAAAGNSPLWGGMPSLKPGYAQHLRDSSWYDPITPPQYLDPNTRWGAFLWKDESIPGKEYGKKQDHGDEGMWGKTQTVVNRSHCAEELKGKPGYVPHLSLHTPVFTAKDYRTWRMFSHQPSTNNQ